MKHILDTLALIGVIFISASCSDYRQIDNKVTDKLTAPELKDVRLEGAVGKKMETFFQGRILSEFAKDSVMKEAEDAFKNKIDDVVKAPIGYWQGEFWGKLMISASRVARYHNTPEEIKYISEVAHRLLQFQEEDGYLGTYSDKEFVTSPDLKEAEKVMGWDCDWCWNLWCRKYTMWGLLQAYETTGEKELLDAVVKSMDQEIEMLKKLGLKMWETGTPHFCGLPSCSVLKPLLQLYKYTGYERYLKLADEIVANWDCEDLHKPALISNAFTGKPISEWYPNPESWAKAYEMMSCLDGLLEYYRVTGNERCLEAVKLIQKNLWQNERNQMDNVAFNDQFCGGGIALNGISEPCDAIHWMRLNHDLFLITGDPSYMDVIERTFFNAFLAGVYRDGNWGSRGVRSEGRHFSAPGQAMLHLNHCCVNNMPRGFMDIAQSLVSMDAAGTVYVNWYSDSKSTIGGCSIEVTGNYPVSDRAYVTINAPVATNLKFRIPAWSGHTTVDGAEATTGWYETEVNGSHTFEVFFDMTPKVVDSDRQPVKDPDWKSVFYRRWVNTDTDLKPYARLEPCARIYRGPLILAKSKFVGDTQEQIYAKSSINHQGWTAALVPISNEDVWGAWELTLSQGNKSTKVNVCDYGSAGDLILPEGEMFFSIYF